jgi:hypothetical protein
LRHGLLALAESSLHLAADEQRVRGLAQEPEADFVVDYVAHESAVNLSARFGSKFVAMIPALERTFLLNVREVMIPFEIGDARDPARAEWQKGNYAK